MKRVPLLISTIAFAIVVSVKPAWCLDVNPEDASGSAGSTVVIPIILSVPTEGFELQTFGFTFNFDSDVLSFDSADRAGTLTHSFDFFSALLIAPETPTRRLIRKPYTRC
jgi:hypothetical protein